MATRDPLVMPFEPNLTTQDRQRWERTRDFLQRHPTIRLVGPTWGWLEAGYRTMDTVSAPGYAERITTPALVFGAEEDRIVLTSAIFDFARHMPNATYIEIPGAEHEILMERDPIRERFWKAFDAFVDGLG